MNSASTRFPTPRIRMFAGPNGSGKTTLKGEVPLNLQGNYINPDEIEEQIRFSSSFDFRPWNLEDFSD